MPTAETNRSSQPTDTTMKQFVSALNDIATALARNTEQLQTMQQRTVVNGETPGGGPGDRNASIEQARTTLDYKVISQLMGRRGFVGQTVRARLEVSGTGTTEKKILRLFDVPDNAEKVAIHVDGAAQPFVVDIDTDDGGVDARGTVTGFELELGPELDGKNIARIEVQDFRGFPIRLGPRLTADTIVRVP